jgi:hypothetical protein
VTTLATGEPGRGAGRRKHTARAESVGGRDASDAVGEEPGRISNLVTALYKLKKATKHSTLTESGPAPHRPEVSRRVITRHPIGSTNLTRRHAAGSEIRNPVREVVLLPQECSAVSKASALKWSLRTQELADMSGH